MTLTTAYAISSRANTGGWCNPSTRTIKKDIRSRSNATVQRAITKLVELGELTVVSHRHGLANEYILVYPAYRECPTDKGTPASKVPHSARQGAPIDAYEVPHSVTSGALSSRAKGKEVKEPKRNGSGSASVSGFQPAGETRPGVSRTPFRPAPAKPSKQSHQGKDDPPAIRGYEDIATLAEIDPIRAAQAVTGDSDEWSLNGWRKELREAESVIGEAQARKVWIECLHRLYGEIKTGEVHNPSAYLNKLFREAIGVARPAPPEPVRMRSERTRSTDGDEPSPAAIQNLLEKIVRPIPHAFQPIDDAEAARRMADQRARLEEVIRREKPK